MYVIEKNVPIEEKRGRKPKYPFDQMEIGDSFLVIDRKDKNIVRAAAHMYGRKNTITFKTQTVEQGVRVWRIA